MIRWARPLVVSVVVHGAAVGTGAWFLGERGREPLATNSYPVSLVIEGTAPGPQGPPAGEPGPLTRPGPAPPRAATLPQSAPIEPPMVPPVPAETSSLGVPAGGGSVVGGGGAAGGGGGGADGTGGEGGSGAPGGGAPHARYQPPRLLAGALPLDPDDVALLRVPGEIPVKLRVGADGRVKEIVPEIEDLPGPVLEALRRSADAMRFAPARTSGQPVEGWFSMTFVFRR